MSPVHVSGLGDVYDEMFVPFLREQIAARQLYALPADVLSRNDFVRFMSLYPDKHIALDLVHERIQMRLDELHPGYPYITRWP